MSELEIELIRCNACMTVMEETIDDTIVKCLNCSRDDCLMDNFIPHKNDILWKGEYH